MTKSYNKAKVIIFIILIIILALLFNIIMGDSQMENTFNHLKISRNFETVKQTTSIKASPVSLAGVDSNHILYCSYVGIYLLELNDNTSVIREVPKPKGIDIWNPTGLYYDQTNKLLYVANYKGKDILIFNYDMAMNKLVLKHRITNNFMLGPENLTLDKEHNIIVADYDGNAVLKFKPTGQLLWRTKVGQAHGVTCLNEIIYATSLTDRNILKMDFNGKIIQKRGKMGIARGEYLWPVNIAGIDKNRIIVVDAHTGRINILNEELQTLNSIGGNGPGVDLLNYPYCLIAYEDSYFVADTLKGRILRLTKNWDISSQILVFDRQISKERNLPIFYGTEKGPYTYPSMGSVDILSALSISNIDDSLKPCGGFNSIDYIDKDGLTKMEVEIDDPKIKSLWDENFWYMTWALRISLIYKDDVILLSSPQSPKGLVIDTATGAWDSVDIPIDTWLVNGKLINKRSSIDPIKMVIPSVNKFDKLKQLIEQGATRSEAFGRVFCSQIDKNEMNNKFWQNLLSSTPEGQKFFQQFNSGHNLENAAIQYFSNTADSSYKYLREILAVKFLAGSSFKFQNLNSKAQIMSETRYYEGCKPQVALSSGKSGYVAALEDQPDYSFKVNFKENMKVYSMVFEWLDNDNYPTNYDVYCFDKSGTVLEKVSVVDNSNYRNTVLLVNKKPVTSITIKFNKFHGQQRLLMRSLNIYGRNQPIDKESISSINKQVSNQINYSAEPLTYYDDSLYNIILKNGKGHCGHFAYLLACRIKDLGGSTRVYDIALNNGIVHSVVEVYDEDNNRWLVADPTIGIIYNYNLEELSKNPEKAQVEDISVTKAKQFKGYFGTEFFEAKPLNIIIRSFSSIEKDLLESTVKLNNHTGDK